MLVYQIQQAAAAAGENPQHFCNRVSAEFKVLLTDKQNKLLKTLTPLDDNMIYSCLKRTIFVFIVVKLYMVSDHCDES